jgi:hypothetical protein
LYLNFPTSFRCIKALKWPTIFSSNIKTDVRDIYLSLNVIRVRLHFRPFSLQKNKTHGILKHNETFRIKVHNLHSLLHIYFQSIYLSLEYSCIFSL